MDMLKTISCAAAMMAFPVIAAGWAQAEDQPAKPALVLELNAAQPSDKGCRLTFVVTNNLGGELSKAAFEMAMFNEAGVVDRLTVLDFKDLPAGKTKVARFDLGGADCGKISRLLINAARNAPAPASSQRPACATCRPRPGRRSRSASERGRSPQWTLLGTVSGGTVLSTTFCLWKMNSPASTMTAEPTRICVSGMSLKNTHPNTTAHKSSV